MPSLGKGGERYGVLGQLQEMLHFELTAVALRATLHKADALLATPEGAAQATLRALQTQLGVEGIASLIPAVQSSRFAQLEAGAWDACTRDALGRSSDGARCIEDAACCLLPGSDARAHTTSCVCVGVWVGAVAMAVA